MLVPLKLDQAALAHLSDGDLQEDAMHVIAAPSGDSIKATVLYLGTPVMIVTAYPQDYSYALPVLTDNDRLNSYRFLIAIGEAGYDLLPWLIAHPGEDPDEQPLGADVPPMGDGHQVVALWGLVCNAMHAAFPQVTSKPTGF